MFLNINWGLFIFLAFKPFRGGYFMVTCFITEFLIFPLQILTKEKL